MQRKDELREARPITNAQRGSYECVVSDVRSGYYWA